MNRLPENRTPLCVLRLCFCCVTLCTSSSQRLRITVHSVCPKGTRQSSVDTEQVASLSSHYLLLSPPYCRPLGDRSSDSDRSSAALEALDSTADPTRREPNPPPRLRPFFFLRLRLQLHPPLPVPQAGRLSPTCSSSSILSNERRKGCLPADEVALGCGGTSRRQRLESEATTAPAQAVGV